MYTNLSGPFITGSTRRFFRWGLAAGALSRLSAESSLENSRESTRERSLASTPPVLALAVDRPLRRVPFELVCKCGRSSGGGVDLLDGLRARGLLLSAAGRFSGNGTGVGADCDSIVMVGNYGSPRPTYGIVVERKSESARMVGRCDAANGRSTCRWSTREGIPVSLSHPTSARLNAAQ